MATELTAERLRELYEYDAETGVFTRRVRLGKFQAGTASTYRDRHGYPSISLEGRLRRVHRLAWLYMTGEWPKGDIDHINGVRHDNRWTNLRNVSRSVNLQNKRAPQSNSGSGFLGVSVDKNYKNKWRARLTVNKREVYVAYFDTPEEAHAAYVAAKRRLHEGCTI